MKQHLIFALLAIGATSSTGALATDIEEYARVLNVTPQVDRVNQPRQVCGAAPAQERSLGGSIIGGVAGALLGNQVGNGNGRVAATAAGAITGAIVGDRIDNQGGAGQGARDCQVVDNWQERANGYLVTYEYNGRQYTTVMPNRPGDRIKLYISIIPSRM